MAAETKMGGACMGRLVMLTAALTLAGPSLAGTLDAPAAVGASTSAPTSPSASTAAIISPSAAVSDAAALKPLLDDRRLAEFAAGHPGAELRPIDPDVYDEDERPGGGRRFVFRFGLRSCATCEELEDARVAFDYDGQSRSLGPRLLTVENPPLFAAEGDVVRGKDFEARIDASRVFRLKAFSEGWVIEVTDDKGNNYCSVVTPPYRGTNHLEIFGWHFRNADNTGPNAPGEKNVNAPGEHREFRCLATAADAAAASRALDVVLRGEKTAAWRESDEAYQLHGRFVAEAQRGTLSMSRLALGSLGAGRRPWIASMHFRFELRPPGGARAR
jgi:hypothetical protein